MAALQVGCSGGVSPSGSSAGAGAGGAAAGNGGALSQAGIGGEGAAGGLGGNVANGGAGAAGDAAVSGAAGSAGSSGAGGSAGEGGGGGGGGTGGAAGSAGYDPCPTNGDPCRVMPLGDSITDGYQSTTGAGYRLELFRLSLMNKKRLTFVGSGQNGPNTVDPDNTPFPRHHEGHSGWTIDDGGGRSGLYPKIIDWLNANPPHIVTLMIGTNDVGVQIDLANAPARLGLLLDRIITTTPNALIVLAQIVPTTNDNDNGRVRTYNAAMPELVKTRADAGKHIVLVDMYGSFTQNADFKTAYMKDGLHPNDVGYAAMANVWWPAIRDLLPNQ